MKILSTFLLVFSFLYSMDNVDPDLLDLDQGKQLYEETCISCHGEKGDAKTALHLVVKPRDLTKTVLNKNQIFKIIKNGSLAYGSKADIMPSFGTVFDDEQIGNLTNYVYETFVKPESFYKKNLSKQVNIDLIPVNLKTGEMVFEKACSKCHGITGNGESDYVEKAKKDERFIYPYNFQKILLDENQIFLYAKYGGKYWGTEQNVMPSWKHEYSDTELKSVAHYIKQIIQNSK